MWEARAALSSESASGTWQWQQQCWIQLEMGWSRSSVSSLSPLSKGGSNPLCIKLVFVPACLSADQLTHLLQMFSYLKPGDAPEIVLPRIWKLFLIKLSVCQCFQGHITLWNHGIKIIAFEIKGGSCALHQKFLLVLINPYINVMAYIHRVFILNF